LFILFYVVNFVCFLIARYFYHLGVYLFVYRRVTYFQYVKLVVCVRDCTT